MSLSLHIPAIFTYDLFFSYPFEIAFRNHAVPVVSNNDESSAALRTREITELLLWLKQVSVLLTFSETFGRNKKQKTGGGTMQFLAYRAT